MDVPEFPIAIGPAEVRDSEGGVTSCIVMKNDGDAAVPNALALVIALPVVAAG